MGSGARAFSEFSRGGSLRSHNAAAISMWVQSEEEAKKHSDEPSEDHPYLVDARRYVKIIFNPQMVKQQNHGVMNFLASVHASKLPAEGQNRKLQEIVVAELGQLCWIGGADVQNYIRECGVLRTWTVQMQSHAASTMKSKILQSVGEACRGNRENQDFLGQGGWIPILHTHLGDADRETARWAAMTLFLLLCNHAANQNIALDVPTLQDRLWEVSELDWKGWNQNAAVEVLEMLDYVQRS